MKEEQYWKQGDWGKVRLPGSLFPTWFTESWKSGLFCTIRWLHGVFPANECDKACLWRNASPDKDKDGWNTELVLRWPLNAIWTLTHPLIYSLSRLGGTYLPGGVVWDSNLPLSCKLPEPQEGSILQALFYKKWMGPLSLIVQDWLFLLLLHYFFFPEPSHWYLHVRLRCWQPSTWEMKKGVCWGSRLVTLAIVPGCSAIPHPAGCLCGRGIGFYPPARGCLGSSAYL